MKEAQFRTAFFLLLLLLVLVLTFFLFRPYLITFSVAATAAIIFHPVYDVLQKTFRGREMLAAFCTVLATVILVLVPLALFGIQLATEAADVYKQLSSGDESALLDLIRQGEQFVQEYLPSLSLNLEQYAGQGLQWIAGNIGAFFAGTVKAVVQVFLGLFAYYYLLKDGRRFLSLLMEVSPLTQHEDEGLSHRLVLAVNSVIRGSLIIAMLQGAIAGIGLSIFGIPNAVLLGAIAGVGALIPNVGTTIVMAPVGIYLVLTGQYTSAIGLALWALLAVGLIDNLLHPILIGRGMRMHPFLIFFAVIGGIAMFGIAGFILGPLIISLLAGLLDILREEVQ